MSQSEIYQILKNKRLSGDNLFYGKEEIAKLLLDKDIKETRYVGLHLKKLAWFGYLDFEIVGNRKVYRLKKDYL